MQFSLRSLLVLVFLAALMAWVFRAQAERAAWREAGKAAPPLTWYADLFPNEPAQLVPILTAQYSESEFRHAVNSLRGKPHATAIVIEGELSLERWKHLAQWRHLRDLAVDRPPPVQVADLLPRLHRLKIRPKMDPLESFEPFVTRCGVRELCIDQPGDNSFRWLQPERLRALRTLEVRNSYLTRDQCLAIWRMSALRELRLQWYTLDPGFVDSLRRLPHLETLAFDRCRIPFGELRALARLPHLKRLRFTRTALDQDDISAIGRCTDLVELSLPGDYLGWADLSDLAGLARLKRLDLHGYWELFPGEDAGKLASLPILPRLEVLNLHRTHAEPAGWRTLLRQGRLRSVSLVESNIPADVLKELQRRPTVTQVNY